MATMNITLLITLILYAYRFVDKGKILLLLEVNSSDAPRVGYTTYMDWWFYPILYYLCFALYEFILVQVTSDRHRVESSSLDNPPLAEPDWKRERDYGQERRVLLQGSH